MRTASSRSLGCSLAIRTNLKVFGSGIANRSVELSGYEENLGAAIYAPEPVPLARICEEIEIRVPEDEWYCRDRDYGRYPADVDTLWFYTRIQAAPPAEVVHRWRYGNEAAAAGRSLDAELVPGHLLRILGLSERPGGVRQLPYVHDLGRPRDRRRMGFPLP